MHACINTHKCIHAQVYYSNATMHAYKDKYAHIYT